MTLKLTRNTIFFIGLCLILVYVAVNRLNFIRLGNFTNGKVYNIVKTSGNHTSPVIEFSTDSLIVKFHSETDEDLEPGQQVEVIYQRSDPRNAKVYSFIGFWLSPLLYCILPVIVLAAAVYSFLSKRFVIHVGKGKNSMNRDHVLPEKDQQDEYYVDL